jgi:hypothetical protein
MFISNWLVDVGGIPTPLKNISQWEGLSHILWKLKNVPNHQPVKSSLPEMHLYLNYG